MVETSSGDFPSPIISTDDGYLIDPVAADALIDLLDPVPEEEEEDVAPLPKFDPRFREDFEGLLYIGKLRRQVRWLGHKFTLRTMNVEELMEAGQLHKPYVGTISDIKAWQSIIIAAAIETVDGRPLPLPMSDQESEFEAKFHYILRHWYPITVDRLYEEYLILEDQVQKVIEQMGKA